ncbi:MAG: T9SS type A sorting domain-containing protein [Cytophagaceae bacterium]|jgi:subtilisin-like proprotein convertase family protein|nr:T9SS type A sorting domain-containing protein [Cytophagaceae bacterium]
MKKKLLSVIAANLHWFAVVVCFWQANAWAQSSLHFDASGCGATHVSIPLVVNTTEITHEFWFKTSRSNGGLFSIYEFRLGGGYDRGISIVNGNVQAYVWTSSNPETIITSGTNYADGNWHHIAHVIGSSVGGQRLYVDGLLKASGVNTTSGFNWNTVVILGYSPNGQQDYFDGQIDELRIWNVARTDSQISSHMNCSFPTSAPGLRGNYHFDDGVANANNAGLTTLTDASGNAYNGTLYNFSLTGSVCNWITNVSDVGNLPALSISTTGNNVCAGSNITLTASGASNYSWTGGITNGTPFAINATNNYVVTGSNGACVRKDSITITVFNGVPSVNLGPDGVVCSGSFVVLDAGFPGSTYLWSDNSTAQTLSVTSPGSYSVTVTNACGVGSDNIVLTSALSPSVFLGPDTSRCNGSVTLNAGNPSASYLWSDNSTAQTLQVTSSGTYFVKVTNANGCYKYDTIRVNISTSVPIINLGADQKVCGTTTSSVTLNPNSNQSNVTYVWSQGAATSPTLVVTTSNNYSVSVTNSCGVSRDSVSVVFESLPAADFLGSSIKQCGSATIHANVAGATYFWSTGATTPSITVTTSGLYKATVTNSCGASKDEVYVNIGTPISLNLGADATICSIPGSFQINPTLSHSTDTILAVESNSTNFAIPDLNPGGVFSPVTAVSSLPASTMRAVILNEITHPFLADLDIRLIAPNGSTIDITTDNGFDGDNYIETYFSNVGTPITVAAPNTIISASYAPFTGNFQPEQPFTQLTGTANGIWNLKVSDDASQDVGTLKKWTLIYAKEANTPVFTWNSSVGLSATSILNPIANPTTTTTYALTVTDTYGCTATDSITIFVRNGPPSVSLGADRNHCGPLTLDAANSGSAYTWSDASTGQTLLVSTSGTYHVAVDNGCGIEKDTVVLTIDPVPAVNLGADISQCGGTINLDAGNSGNTFSWSNAATTQTITAAVTGTYSVVVTNAQNCQGKDSVEVYIQSAPVVDLGADVTQCGGSVNFDVTNPGATYLWHDASTMPTKTLTATAGTLKVKVTVTNACSTVKDSMNLTIHSIPTVTLTLTPNTVCDNVTNHNLSGGSPAGGIFSGTGVSGSVFNATTVGAGNPIITYTFTDANNCSASAQATLTVSNCASALSSDVTTEAALQLAPNPTSGVFVLSYSDISNSSIEIFTLQGERVAFQLLARQEGAYTLDISGLSEGMYLVYIRRGEKSEIRKVMIQK